MSKAITERRDDSPQVRWQTPVEVAPSALEDTAPVVARYVGAFGLALVVLGGVSLATYLTGRPSFITPGWGTFLLSLGIGGLLFHAANEPELQIRRVYMGLGFLLLAAGALLSLVPYRLAGTDAAAVGALFLPAGPLALVLGLFFTMGFVRNETEAPLRDLAVHVIGAVGAVATLVGFIGGTIEPRFLIPYGVVLIPLGFVFVWAFLSLRGIVNEWGYLAAWAVGIIGAVFFLIALGRSVLPPLLERIKVLHAGTAPYTMPNGLLLMIGGLLYVALALAYVSDRQFVVLTRRELGSLFFSPLAYFMLVGYTLLGWQIFGNFVYGSLWQEDLTGGPGGPRTEVEPIVINYILAWFPVICVLVLVPLLTMRLLSEEQRTGTLEMTLTAPVDETVVVASKFLAALIFFLLVWMPWGVFLISLRVAGGTPFDYRPVLAFGLALVLTGSAFVSMGLFFSSLTRNQVAAAVLTFVGMFLLLYVYFLKGKVAETSPWRTVLAHVSYVDLWQDVLQGKLPTRDIILWPSAALLWLFLTVKVLESRKWR
jgi:ABC-type transport system involved in multi-copper enzyme maturation permease subunit